MPDPSEAPDREPPDSVPPAAGRGKAERSDAGGQTPQTTEDQTLSPRPQDGGTRRSASDDAGGQSGTIQSLLLLGPDHTDLGEVETSELSPNAAIGISRGRFPKGYPHVDPNEDAVFAATDGSTIVLAVADGHHGFDAAGTAILAICGATPLVISSDLEAIVRELTAAAVGAVAEAIPSLPPPRDTSRTALTVCAIRDATIATTTIGDTTCLVATKRRVQRIGSDSPFLSPETNLLAIHVAVAEAPPNSTIIVASDGFTDFTRDIRRPIRAASDQPPNEAVETLIDAAFDGGAGDNIAIGVARPSSWAIPAPKGD